MPPHYLRPENQRRRRRAALPLLLLAALALLAATLPPPQGALATETRRGAEVVIDANEPVREDLYVAAGVVTVRGPVSGDLSAVAGDVRIEGEVGGSVNVLAGRTEVDGRVGRSVRVAGGAVDVRGRVAGDLVVAGGSVRVERGGSVDGDLIVAGGGVEVRGRVGGDVSGNAVRVILGGAVGGDVDVGASQVSVLAGTQIDGNLTYRSPRAASLPAGTEVGGAVRYTSANPFDGPGATATLLGPLRRLLWALIAGAIIVLLLPRGAAAVARTTRRVLAALGVGLLMIWLAPLLAIGLMLSLIGLPIGVILLLCWGIALYVGPIFAGLALGTLLLPRRWDDGGRGFNLLGMTLGLILIAALRLVPLPFVAGAIGAIVTLLGFGALALTVLSRGRPRRASGVRM